MSKNNTQSGQRASICRTLKKTYKMIAGCGIRLCAIERKLENCAYCNDYACEKLIKHYNFDPDSRKRLEEIREKI